MLTKKDTLNILLLLAITAIFFWPVITSPKDLITNGDLISDSVYSSNFMHKTFQNYGERALWNPFFFAGKTHIAHIEYGQYYPTSLLFLFIYKNYFLNLSFIAHFFLAGLFMYIFLKNMNLRRSSATIGAITFMLGRNFLNLYIGDILPVMSYSYVPLVFFAFEKLLEKRNLKWSILFAIATSIQFFAGRVQYFYYTMLALAIYAAIRIITKKNIASIKYVVLAATIFLGIASIQLLPMLEIAPHTIQSEDSAVASYEFSALESVPPKHFLTLILPEFFGSRTDNSYWGAPSRLIDLYIGVIPLILALLALAYSKDERKTPLAVLAIFAILFALGSYAPFYKIIYHTIPGVGLFKVPGRFLMIFTFSMSALAAFGMDWILKADREKLKKVAAITGILAITSVLVTLTLTLLKPYLLAHGEKLLNQYYYVKYADTLLVKNHTFEYFQEKIPMALKYITSSISKLALILTSGFLAIIYLLKSRKKSLVTHILIAIVIIDLLFLTNVYDWTQIREASYKGLNSEEYLSQWDSLAQSLNKDSQIFRTQGFPQSVLVQNNLQTIGGSDSMPIHYSSKYSSIATQDLKTPSSHRLLMLANVKYVLTPEHLPQDYYTIKDENLTYSFSRLKEGTKFTLYETKDVLPRAFIVPHSRQVSLEEQFEMIKSESFNPKEEVLITEATDLPGGQEYKEAEITYYSPNTVQLYAETEKPGFLVISDTYYPGWKAYVNGEETRIYHANYIMRAIHLDAGDNTVEFVYDPFSYKIGKWITLITLGGIAVILLLSKKREPTP